MHSETCTLLFCTFSCLHVPAPLTHPCREALDVISRRHQHQRAPAARVSPETGVSSTGSITCSVVLPELCSGKALSEFLPGKQLSSALLSPAQPCSTLCLLSTPGTGQCKSEPSPQGCRKGKNQEQNLPTLPFPWAGRKGMSWINTP